MNPVHSRLEELERAYSDGCEGIDSSVLDYVVELEAQVEELDALRKENLRVTGEAEERRAIVEAARAFVTCVDTYDFFNYDFITVAPYNGTSARQLAHLLGRLIDVVDPVGIDH